MFQLISTMIRIIGRWAISSMCDTEHFWRQSMKLLGAARSMSTIVNCVRRTGFYANIVPISRSFSHGNRGWVHSKWPITISKSNIFFPGFHRLFVVKNAVLARTVAAGKINVENAKDWRSWRKIKSQSPESEAFCCFFVFFLNFDWNVSISSDKRTWQPYAEKYWLKERNKRFYLLLHEKGKKVVSL